MTLSEIRTEHRRTRLKTHRWHELNHMARARTAQIAAKFGHHGEHGELYHRAKAAEYHLRGQGSTLVDYLHRTKYKKLKDMHHNIAEALRGD